MNLLPKKYFRAHMRSPNMTWQVWNAKCDPWPGVDKRWTKIAEMLSLWTNLLPKKTVLERTWKVLTLVTSVKKCEMWPLTRGETPGWQAVDRKVVATTELVNALKCSRAYIIHFGTKTSNSLILIFAFSYKQSLHFGTEIQIEDIWGISYFLDCTVGELWGAFWMNDSIWCLLLYIVMNWIELFCLLSWL